MRTETLTQQLAFAGTPVPPQSLLGSANIGPVNMGLAERALFVANIGALGAGANVTLQLQSGPSSTGPWTNIAGANSPAMAASNQIATVEIGAEMLPAGSPYVQGVLTVATAASQVSGHVVTGAAAHKPNSANNVAAVASQVVVV